MRVTGRGIVIKDGNLLLMERWRDGLHYFSIPGGGQENNETLEETATREIREETTIEIEVGRLLYELRVQDTHAHHIFLCTYKSGEPYLPDDAPEAAHGLDNQFKPVWVPIEQVKDLPFIYWEPIQKLLVEDLEKGFSKKVKITAV